MARQSLLCYMQSIVWQALGRIRKVPEKPIEASGCVNGIEARFIVRAAGTGEGEEGNPLAPMFLSADSRLVLEAIGTGKAKGATIARKTGMQDDRGQANAKLRGLLKELVDRGILDHDDDGYFPTEQFISCARMVGLYRADGNAA